MRIFIFTFFSLFFAVASLHALDMFGDDAPPSRDTRAEKTDAEEERSGIFSFMNFSFGRKDQPLVLPSEERRAAEERAAEERARPESEFERLKRTAEEGNVDSQMTLGYTYLYGADGIRPDRQKAYRYYSMAAAQNDNVALNNLGSLYYSGIGVARDVKRAAELFKEAANLGNAEAAVNLAFMYLTGGDLDKNLSESIRLFTIAANQDNPVAQFMLGYSYYKGFVVRRNLIRGFELMQAAASADYDVAQLILAQMYIDGSGTTINYAQAIFLLTQATAQGNLDATMKLAQIYVEGVIFPANPFHAHVLFNIAAVHDIPGAAANRAALQEGFDIQTILQAQMQAEEFKPEPSEITTYIRQTFGHNIQNYIDMNMRTR
jgi:TPR repeat protein